MSAPVLSAARRSVVTTEVLGATTLVFDEGSGALHELNHTAALVWAGLDGQSPDVLIDSLALAFDINRDDLEPDVRSIIASFTEAGLLAAEAPAEERAGERATPRWRDRLDALAQAVEDQVHLGPFRAGHLHFTVTTNDAVCAAELSRILASLADTAPGSCSQTYRVLRRDRGWTLLCDGHPLGRHSNVSVALGSLLWTINQAIVAERGSALAVHAGAVSGLGFGDGAAIFPGVSNAGKSTLVAALIRAGWGYLSDEIALIEPDTHDVACVPKAIAFDPGSFAEFPDARPAVDESLEHDLARKWQVDPRTMGVIGDSAKLAVVVGPRFEAGATPKLTALSPRETLDLLLASTFELDGPGFSVLVDIARTTPGYALVSGAIDDTLAVVEPLLHAHLSH